MPKSPHQLQPRRTYRSNKVFSLAGGTEDNDLWVEQDAETIRSVFVPTDEQRKAIADGQNIELIIHGQAQPPVSIVLNQNTIGKPPPLPDELGTCEVEGCEEDGRAFVYHDERGWLPLCAAHGLTHVEAGALVRRPT